MYIKLLIKYFCGFIKLRSVEGIETFPILKTEKFNTLKKAKIFKTKHDIWNSIIKKFSQTKLDYFEFGVFDGKSIKYFSENLKNIDNKFTGFDSFNGLPDVYNHPSLKKGDFSTNGNIPTINDPRVKFIKGFFNQKKNEIKKVIKEATNHTQFVHFDADIYSSTQYLLYLLDEVTPYYALFDEFGGDEARALYHYLISTDKNIEIESTTYDDKFKIVPGKTFMKIY